MSILRQGSSGFAVAQIQRFLMGEGFSAGRDDGAFGPRTLAAVVAYQRTRGLTPDGLIGNVTLGRMLAEGLSLELPFLSPSQPAPGEVPKPDFAPISSNDARAAVFGKFPFTPAPVPGNPEGIAIGGGWEAENIALFQVPQLKKSGASTTGNVRFHRKAKAQLLALWAAWEKAGLLHLVKTWEGAYMPRFVRGSRVTLSNHAFGSAFDINYAWNRLGHVPARSGTEGSVRELVPLAHEHGFYWGGHFGRADGMHFEIAKLL